MPAPTRAAPARVATVPSSQLVLVALCAAGLALALCWPLALGSFLSDDYWFAPLLDREATILRVDWSAVIRDFSAPWLISDNAVYYRPLSSLALALCYEFGDGSPLAFHIYNLTLHAVSSAAVAMLCALLCPRRAALAGLCGGALFALHPIAIEPVAWCASVTSAQEVGFRLLAVLSFALWRSRAAQGDAQTLHVPLLLAIATFSTIALWTKESAVVLPLWIIAVDLLHPARRDWRSLIALGIPVLVTLAYLLARFSLPGFSFGAGDTLASLQSQFFDFVPAKLGMLAFPFAAPVDWLRAPGFWIMALLTVLAVTRALRRPWLLALAALWILAQFAPNVTMTVTPDLFGSRVLYGVVASFALLIAVMLFGAASGAHGLDEAPTLYEEDRIADDGWSFGGTRIAVLVVVAAASALAWRSWQRIGDYELAYERHDTFAQALRRAAKTSRGDAPWCVLNGAPIEHGIELVSEPYLAVLGELPHASKDLAIANLSFVLTSLPGSRDLTHDASILRAMREFGASFGMWNATLQDFDLEAAAECTTLPELTRDGDEWRFARSVSPFDVEALVVDSADPISQASIAVLTSNGAVPLAKSLPQRPAKSTVIDLSHHIGLIATRLAGGVHGFRVELAGSKSPASVRALARVDTLLQAKRRNGSVLGLRHTLADPSRLPRLSKRALEAATNGGASGNEAQSDRGQGKTTDKTSAKDDSAQIDERSKRLRANSVLAAEELRRAFPLPRLPAGCTRARLVLVSQTQGWQIPIELEHSGGPRLAAPSAEVLAGLRHLERVTRQRLVWYWFEADGERPARSPVDWLQLSR